MTPTNMSRIAGLQALEGQEVFATFAQALGIQGVNQSTAFTLVKTDAAGVFLDYSGEVIFTPWHNVLAIRLKDAAAAARKTA